jgi:hypothetical protein
MTYSTIKHFSVDPTVHPKTLEHWETWKKKGVNISHKICQLIEQDVQREEESERKLREIGLVEYRSQDR